jgi:integration host factor subunit beta
MNQENRVTRPDMIQIIAYKQGHLSFRDVDEPVHCILDHMTEALGNAQRIGSRGFDAFSLHIKMGENQRLASQFQCLKKRASF